MNIENHVKDIEGYQLTYSSFGSGEPLVFIHGALADETFWYPHFELLGDSFKCLAPTLRYFNGGIVDARFPFGIETHARDCALCIEEQFPDGVNLVGWSYGADVALYTAHKIPHLIKKLLIYDPGFPSYVSDTNELEIFKKDSTKMFEPIAGFVEKGMLDSAVVSLINASGVADSYFSNQYKKIQKSQLEKKETLLLQIKQQYPKPITADDLKQLRFPAWVGTGRNSRPLFQITAGAAAKSLGNAVFAMLDNESHLFPLEKPIDFAEIVKTFMTNRIPLTTVPFV